MREVIAAAAGEFAENKEKARVIRQRVIRALKAGDAVVLDFEGVALATQSFIHALIAEVIRSKQYDALDMIEFANCNESVRAVIEVVVSYCQDDWSGADDDAEFGPDATASGS